MTTGVGWGKRQLKGVSGRMWLPQRVAGGEDLLHPKTLCFGEVIYFRGAMGDEDVAPLRWVNERVENEEEEMEL